ncbi:MAG TPA: hypothetical protein VMT89_00545 [Candidatus Acidoferrales bacterium]|nr:hypothetical protein [Candidatus Acidoferrales bacterium]
MKGIPDIGSILTKVRELLGKPTEKPVFALDPSGNGGLVAVRNGYTLARYNGQSRMARNHKFLDIRSFADFLNRHVDSGEPRLAAEILAREYQIVAQLSPRDLNSDTLTCDIQKHPAFVPWDNLFGRQITQRDLLAFVRANKTAFLTAGDDTIGDYEQLVGGLKTLEIIGTKTLKTTVEEHGFISLDSDEGKVEHRGKLPTSFRLQLPILLGVCDEPAADAKELQYSLEVLVFMDTDDGVSFKLICPELAMILHKAREDALAFLRMLLEEGFLVGMGTLATAQVPVYLPVNAEHFEPDKPAEEN